MQLIGVEGGVCLHELTPFAIVFSAVVALLLAWVGWWVNRNLTREQAAVALILEREAFFRDDFFSLSILINKHADDSSFFEMLADKVPTGLKDRTWNENRRVWNLPVEQKQWLTVFTCLNYYEAIAVSIEQKAIDKKTVEKFMRGKFVNYFQILYPFILAIRNKQGIGTKSTWKSLERRAKKWGAKTPLKN